jgi:hypothetical protein
MNFFGAEVDPVIDFNNLKDISQAIENIQLDGDRYAPNYSNSDCPEHGLHGIQEALKYAGPKSILFVFTDADANDLEIKDEVLNTLQENQATVNFFFSNGCGEVTDLYREIAKSTNGLFTSMKKSDIKNVLKAMSSKIDSDYSIVNIESIPAGLFETPVEVGENTKEISGILQGNDAKISIRTPKNETIHGTPLGKDTEMVVIKNPSNGTHTIITNTKKTSETDRAQLQIGVKDNITLDYGFSLVRPSDKNKTQYQPIEGIA